MLLPVCASRPCHILLVASRLVRSPVHASLNPRHFHTTTSSQVIQKKPEKQFMSNTFRFSVTRLEKRVDGMQDHMKMVYRTSMRNFIYAGQCSTVPFGLSVLASIGILAFSPEGVVFSGPALFSQTFDRVPTTIGFAIGCLVHLVAIVAILRRCPLRVYLDEEEDIFAVAMPHLLIPFRTKIHLFEARSLDLAPKGWLPFTQDNLLMDGRRIMVRQDEFSTPFYFSHMRKDGGGSRPLEM